MLGVGQTETKHVRYGPEKGPSTESSECTRDLHESSRRTSGILRREYLLLGCGVKPTFIAFKNKFDK